MENLNTLLGSLQGLLPGLEFDELIRLIPDNAEIIRIALGTPAVKTFYKDATRFQNDPKKNVKEAILYREKGNQCYRERKYVLALEYYNKSICFAPDGSEQLAKAYANRSAVYFSMEMFDLSLENIKLARNAGYPENSISRLNEREKKSMNKMKQLETMPKKLFENAEPELSYPPHEKVPFIANCLELKVNEKYGRHIVTTADLKIGDIVAIEEPFYASIIPGAQYLFCANCFRQKDLNLIPCPNCHSAMFCSVKCLIAANEAFHSIECPIIDVLVRSDMFEVRSNVALRLFIMAMKHFKSAAELMKFVKDLKKRDQNVFNVNYKESRDIDLLASILKLVYFADETIEFNYLHKVFTMASMTEVVLKLTSFKELFKSDEEITFLRSFFYDLYETTIFNSTECSEPTEFEATLENPLVRRDVIPSYGIYPFLNLLNHSCASNTLSVYETKNVIFVCKPIKKGEQLFNCYNITHKESDRVTRQLQIRNALKFICDCNACIHDYPIITASEQERQYKFINPIQHFQLCNYYNFNAVKELIPKYIEYLTVNAKSYPHKHTMIAEKLLHAFFHLIYCEEVPLLQKYLLQLYRR